MPCVDITYDVLGGIDGKEGDVDFPKSPPDCYGWIMAIIAPVGDLDVAGLYHDQTMISGLGVVQRLYLDAMEKLVDLVEVIDLTM